MCKITISIFDLEIFGVVKITFWWHYPASPPWSCPRHWLRQCWNHPLQHFMRYQFNHYIGIDKNNNKYILCHIGSEPIPTEPDHSYSIKQKTILCTCNNSLLLTFKTYTTRLMSKIKFYVENWKENTFNADLYISPIRKESMFTPRDLRYVWWLNLGCIWNHSWWDYW